MSDSNITYLDTTLQLSKDIINKYYEKIKSFVIFTPYIIHILHTKRLYYGLKKWRNIDEEEYKKFKTNPLNKSIYYVGKKIVDIDKTNFMYFFDEEDSDKLDDIDKKFIETQTVDKKIELYGMHEFNEHLAFSGPYIYEIIQMLNTEISTSELANIERIYVTTQSYTDKNTNTCYDQEKKKYRAKTTFYIINVENSGEKQTNTNDSNNLTTTSTNTNHCDKKQKIKNE